MIRIAIDGPGGAGKSTIAKAIAKEMGIIYVDTGALYRTIGKYALDQGIDTTSADDISRILPDINLEMKFQDGKQIILLNDEDYGDSIRTPEVSMAASNVSAIGRVREFLLDVQRNIAKTNSVVMDGRDIGTVILPNAEVKIFLTATAEARAKRRYDEYIAKGISKTYEEVFEEMQTRDSNDSSREIAPLKPADDAIYLDNSELDFQQTLAKILKIIKKTKKKLNKKGSGLYMFLHAIVSPVYRFFARVHVIGKENIPKEGGAVICSNHIGINDIFILGTVFPRQLRFMSKKEWFSIPVFKNLITALGAIELDRSGKDVGALKSAIKLASRGSSVVIFPQGHRYPGVNPATTPIKNGAALIAFKSGAPMVPVCIKTKNEKYRLFRKIEIIFGKPLTYEELGFEDGGAKEYENAMNRVFGEICSLGGYSALPSAKENATEEINKEENNN